MAAKDEKEKQYPDWWYQSQYEDEMEELAQRIENRPDFKFKVDQEALYDYCKGEYERQGREDQLGTQARGAGLTGGYDNSYARTAGQQAYEGQMENLHSTAQSMYDQAVAKYIQDGEALVDEYEALSKQEEKAYKQWQKDYKDQIEEWEQEQQEAEEARIAQERNTPESRMGRIVGQTQYSPSVRGQVPLVATPTRNMDLFAKSAENFIEENTQLETARNNVPRTPYVSMVLGAMEKSNLTETAITELLEHYGITQEELLGYYDDGFAPSGIVKALEKMQEQERRAAEQVPSAVDSAIKNISGHHAFYDSIPEAPKHTDSMLYVQKLPTAEDLKKGLVQYESLKNISDYAEKSVYEPKDVGARMTVQEMESLSYSEQMDRYTAARIADSSQEDLLYEAVNGNHIALQELSRKGYEIYQGMDEIYRKTPSELQQLTEEEVTLFNYVYKTLGLDAAKDYLNYLAPYLSNRQRVTIQNKAANFAERYPVISSLDTIITSPFRGQIASMGVVSDLLEDGELSENADYNRLDYQANAVRGKVSEMIETQTPLGKVGSFLYGVGMSIGDNAARGIVSAGNPLISAQLMASSAGSSMVSNAKDLGLHDHQALALGVISAVAEGFFEKHNLEALLNTDLMNDGALKYILKNSLNEATEEVSTEVVNTVADIIIAWDKGQMRTAIDTYKAQGLDAKQASLKAFGDKLLEIGEAGLSGAISGGAMSGGMVTLNSIVNAVHKDSAATEKNSSSVPDTNVEKLAVPEQEETNAVGSPSDGIRDQIRSYQKELNDMSVVADVQVPAEYMQMDIAGKKNWVEEKLRPTGYQVERKGFGIIEFAKKRLKSAFNYFGKGSAEEAAFEAIPYVLEKGIEISSRDNHKDREYGTVTIAAPVSINGKRGNMAVVVKKTTGNHYKVHRILMPDGSVFVLPDTASETGFTPTGEAPVTGSLATSKNPVSTSIVEHESENVNREDTELPTLEGEWETEAQRTAREEAARQARESGENVLGPYVASALDDIRQQGKISLMSMLLIEKDAQSMQKLTELTGVEIPEGDSEARRAAIEEAVSILAEQPIENFQSEQNTFWSWQDTAWDELVQEYVGTEQTVQNQVPQASQGARVEAGATSTLNDRVTEAAAPKAAQSPVKAASQKYGAQAAVTGEPNEAGRKQERQTEGQRKRGTVKGYGVDIKTMAQAFNVNQAYAYKAIAQIADVTGVDVVLFESKPDANGELRGGVIDGIDMSNAQGAFSWHNNKIYVDINAGVLRGAEMGDVAKYAMLRTFTHEFTHFIEKHNAEQYGAFRDLVFDTMRQNGADPDALVQAYMDRNKGVSRDEASREVVAEAMTDILPQSRFVEELAQKHSDIFKTLHNKLKKFLQRIKAYFKSIGSSQSAEVAAVTQYMDGALRYTQQVVDAFDRAAAQAVENYQEGQTAQKNTASEGGVQYSLREFEDGARFVDVQMDPTVFDGMTVAEMNQAAKKILMEKFAGRVIGIDNRVFVNGDSVNEYLHPSKSIDLDTRKAKLTASGELDNLLDAGTALPNEPDGKDGHIHPDAIDFSYFKTIFKVGAEYFEGVVNIKNIKRGKLFKDVTKIRNITKDIVSSYGQNPKSNFLRDASMNSIRSESENVNKNSSGQQNQERKGTITNRDIIAQIEGKTALEREKLQEYQELLNKAQEQSQIAAQKQAELDELLKTEGAKDGKKVLTLREDIMKAKNRRSVYDGMIRRMETGILSVLIEREKGSILEKLRNTYGTIPKGEKAVRDDSLPVSVDGKTKVSRTARTVKGAGVTPDEFADLIDTEVVKGGLSYVPITNDKTTQEAVEWISNEGWETARAKWHAEVQAGKTGADMVARGALLLNNAAKAGDRTAWLDILHDYQFLGTKTAQGMQAMKILKKLAPEDKLHLIERSVEQMARDMKLGFEITIDPKLEAAYQNAKTAKEAKKLLAEIQQSVADQIPSTLMDKWTALRYLNMLGNLKTQIRNVVGNTGMMLVTGMKDTVAIGLEQIAYAASGGAFRKTKSLVVSGEMLKAARADYELVETIIQGGGKYSDSRNESTEFARAVREKQRIFKIKLLEGYRKGTNWAMEKGDVLFSKIAYSRALAGYLKANGVKGGDFSEVDTLLMNEARLYAVQEAQEATFRDANALSEWLSTLGRKKATPERKKATPTPVKWVAEGVMPFRKTVANVLVRAEEYSPLGVVNSLYTSIKAMKKGSEVTGADVINSWAKTLTGTGLFALGMLLQSLGILVGGPDEDDDLDRFEDLNGQQNYALKFGDTYITIDWLSPMAIPLFMGGQTNKMMTDGGISFKDVSSVLTSIADPMIQMSMLQGVNDTLENIRYVDNELGQLLINAMVSYLTQGLTNTMLGQLERGFEDQRMSTYVDKNSVLPDWMQKALGKASAKWPGLDYNQIPYINAWGQEEKNPEPWVNLPYNLLSPSYVSQGQEDAVSRELTRLNEAQSDVNVFPSTPEKKYGDRYLSSEEYVALAKSQGQTQRKIVEGMVGSELYGGLPDAYKAKAIELAYRYARESAQIEVLGRDGFTSDWMAELGENTAEGIVKHVIAENIKTMYLAGDITAEEAAKRRMEYHGDSEDEAKETVAYWDFQTENPEYADWRQETVTKYKDLEPDTAAHVVEVLGGLSAEDGYANVRPVQKLEAIASDSSLSAKDKETAMRANMDSKLEAKYDTARDMGISMGNFVKAYRKYQDTTGQGKKAAVIAYYKKTFGISSSKAEKLYDLFAGKKEE